MDRMVSTKLELLPASVPRPTVTPAWSISGSMAVLVIPAPPFVAAVGHITAFVPVRAIVSTSPWSIPKEWASSVLGPRMPRDSRYSVGRLPCWLKLVSTA